MNPIIPSDPTRYAVNKTSELPVGAVPLTNERAIEFFGEAARYFENRPTSGEDSAHWSNVFNAENCRAIARLLATPAPEPQPEVGATEDVQALVHTQRATAGILRERGHNMPGYHSSWADHMEAVADALAALATPSVIEKDK